MMRENLSDLMCLFLCRMSRSKYIKIKKPGKSIPYVLMSASFEMLGP